MAKTQVYYLCSCDEWKSNSSMRLLFIGTSQTKLMMKISKEIEAENMEYGDSSLTPKQQAKSFRNDWKNKTRDVINGNLVYGHYDYVSNNEEI